MLIRVGFIVVIFTRVALGCDAHPGVPHEKWMRWVDGLNEKYAAEQAAKKSAGKVAEKAAVKADVADRSGRRPVSENGQVRSLRTR